MKMLKGVVDSVDGQALSWNVSPGVVKIEMEVSVKDDSKHWKQ